MGCLEFVMDLKYKGFSGSVEVSWEDNCLTGQVCLVGDMVLYDGKTLDQLEHAFHNAVDSYLEFCEKHNKIPAKSNKQSNSTEQGVIPAGTRIKLYEGRVTLLEDVVVDANQEWIDKAIQDQQDYFNGMGVVCCPKPETTLSGKTGGKLGGKNNNWMY